MEIRLYCHFFLSMKLTVSVRKVPNKKTKCQNIINVQRSEENCDHCTIICLLIPVDDDYECFLTF